MVEFGLGGKVAIVTGASQGIGEAIAVAFAQAGARVVVSSRKLESIAKVAQEIESAGGQAIAIQAHMGYMDQVKSLVAQTLDKWERVDIIVNNAGTNPHFGPILTADEGQFEKILDINLKGYFRLAQAVVPQMKEQGGGKIINVASIAGLRPPHKMGVYGISKAGDIMLTQVLARELGPYNIQVNAIAPGIVQTKFSRALWEDAELMARHEANVPLRRIGTPEDVTGAALYLASSASDWVTGTVLVVDGGANLISMV
ncbi:MAG: glucose 1-dehydrogenase [Chloroflexi bacterium]|nr:glucose 1-dehydrogenase [Chloroflexota bacterium]